MSSRPKYSSTDCKDPLKFRKEKSDVSEHQPAAVAAMMRSRTDNQQLITPQGANNTKTVALTKSCGDAKLFNQARVRIEAGGEGEESGRARVEDTIAFDLGDEAPEPRLG